MAETETQERKFVSKPGAIHVSLANYINANTGDEVEEVSPAQAHALLTLHKHWQGSDERKEERKAEIAQREQEAKVRAEQREEEKARKKAEKEAADAKKKAEEAADAGDDSDLDDLDGESDDTPAPKATARRSRRKAPAAAAAEDDDL